MSDAEQALERLQAAECEPTERQGDSAVSAGVEGVEAAVKVCPAD